jgi:ectoine hydroxylase-related dioxygenase (phytanoyl-CoA dioxygenase family)
MSNWLLGRDPKLAELRESNDIIDDRAALDRAWERDGYWFFRGVLDKNAVARLRAAYVEEIAKLGAIDPGETAARYNGGDLSKLPQFPASIQGLHDRAPWREFVAEPTIHTLISKVLGDEPYWVPIVGYRAQPPLEDPTRDRFTYVHQDGFFNEGIAFRNCWIPLVEMDEDLGGLAVAEGCHGTTFHDTSKPPRFDVPVGAIPRSAWRRSNYHPGDVVVMHLNTPHSGITNLSSDRFRLSLDIRMLPASSDIPAIGAVKSISSEKIVIESEHHEPLEFAITDETYCRVVGPDRLVPSQIPLKIKPGQEVIVAHRAGRALVVRLATY